ncbi:MAG: polysaccharide biosynthesis C-terminal domain-containing protein [Gemmatimonadota bacterium]
MKASPDAAVGRGFRKLGGGEAFARVIAFVATAFLARRLGADIYGIIVLSTTILGYLGRIVDGGVDLLGISDVAAAPQHLPELLRRYSLARLLIAVCLTVLLTLVCLIFLPEPDAAIVAAFAFMLPALALGTKWAHLGLEHAGSVSIARLSAELLSALLITVLIRDAGALDSVPTILIAAESLAAFLLMRSLPAVTVTLRELFRSDEVLLLYRRSWPLVLNALMGLVIFNSDFLFLRVVRDSASVGYYAAAYAMVSFFMNMGYTYQLMLLPVLTRVRSDAAAECGLYHASLAQVFAVILPIVIGGSILAAQIISLVFGHTYVASVLPLRILLWAMFISLVRNVAQSVLLSRGRQDRMLRYALGAGLVNLALNSVLIPRWGMSAAATVTVATEAARTAPMLVFLRASGMSIPSMTRFWRALLAGCVMALVLRLSGVTVLWAAIPLGAVAYVLVLFLTRGIRIRRGALPELTV